MGFENCSYHRGIKTVYKFQIDRIKDYGEIGSLFLLSLFAGYSSIEMKIVSSQNEICFSSETKLNWFTDPYTPSNSLSEIPTPSVAEKKAPLLQKECIIPFRMRDKSQT